MKCRVEYTDLSKADLKEIDSAKRIMIRKAIDIVSQNPLPKDEGGYAAPLVHKQGKSSAGLYKIKLLKLGIRIVYKVVWEAEAARLIVIAIRRNDEAHEIAAKRNKQY